MTFIPKQGATIERPCGLMCFICTCQDKKPNMEQGIRNNQGKPQWSQIDFKSLEPMVRVLEYGETKVGRDNWRSGLLVRETIESLLRHTFALLSGEDNDQESKLPHIGHILSNAMFISYMLQNRPDMDNRQKKEEPKGGGSKKIKVPVIASYGNKFKIRGAQADYWINVMPEGVFPCKDPFFKSISSTPEYGSSDPGCVLLYALSHPYGISLYPDLWAKKAFKKDFEFLCAGSFIKIEAGMTIEDAYRYAKDVFDTTVLVNNHGGVLNESNSRQIAEDFAKRLQDTKEEPPKIVPRAYIYPKSVEDELAHWVARHKRAQQQNANIGRSYPKELQWKDINKEEPEVGIPIEYRHGDDYRGTMIFSWGNIETCAMTHWRLAI